MIHLEATKKMTKDSSSKTNPSSTFIPGIATLKIETSSSIQVIEPTRTTVEIQPTIVPLESNSDASSSIRPTLDPNKMIQGSIVSSSSQENHQSTPIEGLPLDSESSTSSRSAEAPSSAFDGPTAVTGYYIPSVNANNYPYRPRPGIVLDDTLDYTKKQTFAIQRPHASIRHPQIGDIFDVTVSAIQGPGGGSGDGVRVSVNPNGGEDVILTSAVEGRIIELIHY